MGFYKDIWGNYEYIEEQPKVTGRGIINPYHECRFINTDMKKSWCVVCDVEAEYSFALGKYVAKATDPGGS